MAESLPANLDMSNIKQTTAWLAGGGQIALVSGYDEGRAPFSSNCHLHRSAAGSFGWSIDHR